MSTDKTTSTTQVIEHPNKNMHNNVARLLLGGVSCMTAATFTNPADVVKVRLQIQGEKGVALNRILTVSTNEGLRGLYKGITASWMREGTYSAIRLGLYEPFKGLLGETDPKTTPLWMKFAAGSMSGAVGSFFGNPSDLLKIRMQAVEGPSRSVIWHGQQIYDNFGVNGFFKGLQAAVFRAMILNACQLGTYDHVQFAHKMIIVAGIVMGIATSPVDVIKTRLMNQSTDKGSSRHYKGFTDCLKDIWKNEGLRGFYKGLTAQWARLGPFTIIQLMVWEKLRKLCGIQGI